MSEHLYLGSSVADAFYEAIRRWRSQRDSDPNRLSVHDLVEQAFASYGLRIEADSHPAATPAAKPEAGAGLDVEALAKALKLELNRTHKAGEYLELAESVAAAYAEAASPRSDAGSEG